jgi:hypothetical protein
MSDEATSAVFVRLLKEEALEKHVEGLGFY